MSDRDRPDQDTLGDGAGAERPSLDDPTLVASASRAESTRGAPSPDAQTLSSDDVSLVIDPVMGDSLDATLAAGPAVPRSADVLDHPVGDTLADGAESLIAASASLLASDQSSLLAVDPTDETVKVGGVPGSGLANARTMGGGGGLSGGKACPSVPGYEILGELGRGGMGVVYLARQIRLNRPCALKMILAGEHASSEMGVRFLVEAETVARLRHPNIVQIYAIGDHEGRPFFELEYVESGNLADKLEGTPMAVRDAALLIERLARAMDEAHRLGIVHRDLKPANILIAGDGQPKITDFGLAKSLESASGLTQTESILGTPSYMAPEQAEGRTKQAGPPADIYALGAIFYETLTGRPPFKAATILQTLEQVKNLEPVLPSRLVPGLPRDAETICLKCLEKEPHRRYATALALAEDLARYVRQEPIQARPTPPWERAWKWVKRRPTAAALWGVSLLLAVVFITGGTAFRAAGMRRERAEQKRISLLRSQAEGFVLHGRFAFERKDWETASSQLDSALALIRSEPALTNLRQATEDMRGTVTLRMSEVDAVQEARTRLAKFAAARDEAVFHQSQYTGLDPTTDLIATRKSAAEALELFGLAGPAAAALDLDEGQYSASERDQVAAGCYELLLILADAVSQPLEKEYPSTQATEALRLLDRTSLIRPATRAVHARRADYLTKLGKIQDAAAEAGLADRGTGADDTAVDEFLMGERAYRKPDLAAAIGHFQRALDHQPDHFWAQYLLASSLLKSHRPAEALAALSACQALRPSFIWIYLLKGVAQGEVGEFALAESDFRRAESMGPDDNARYVLLVNRGAMRIRRHEEKAAALDLESAIALKPGQFPAYLNLSRAQMNLGRHEDAVAALGRAMDANPREAVLYRERSRAHQARSDSRSALADLEQAIRLGGTDVAVAADHVEKGRVLHQEGRFDEAVRAYDQALTLRAGHLTAHRLRAAALMELRRYEEAVRSLDICLSRGTPSAVLYETRGLAKAWMGQYSEALADYTLAIQAGRDTTHLRTHRGWAYLLSEAPKLALAEFAEAIRLDASNADAYNGRGHAHALLRHANEALADAQAALRVGTPETRLIYNSARIYCQVIRIHQTTPAMQTDQGLRNIITYQRKAVDLVRQAVDLVPPSSRPEFWKSHVESDVALDPIRTTPGYGELRARFSTAPPPAQASRAGGTPP